MCHASNLSLPSGLTKALSLKQPFAWLIVIMLNFIISTIAFSIASYASNRIFNTHAASSHSITFAEMIAASLISIGAGRAVDN
jgi:hypothetical protein